VEKESGLRAGVSKIFNLRTDRSGSDINPKLISNPELLDASTLFIREFEDNFGEYYI
jgi:hypothetical protein